MSLTPVGSGKIIFDNQDTSVYGNALTVVGGNGNNTLQLTGRSDLTLGSGHNSITMTGGASSAPLSMNLSGDDTLTLGQALYNLNESGTAKVSLDYGQATVTGGSAAFGHGVSFDSMTVFSGDGVLQAANGATTQLSGGSGSVTMVGGTGNTTFNGGTGQDTMIGGAGQDLFRFDSAHTGGQHLVENFVQGQDKIYLERLSYSYLQDHNAISEVGGNTFISLDQGQTTIELHGVTGLTASDISAK